MRPMRTNVLVSTTELRYEQHGPSGLILPRMIDHPDTAPQIGRVLAIGPRCDQVKVGCTVVWERHSAVLVSEASTGDLTEGEQRWIVNEDDLIVAITPAEAERPGASSGWPA